MSLYYLVVPGTIYIRNFCDRGDTLLHPHTCFHTSVQRMEVTLIPNDQSTNLEHLIRFTRNAFSSSSSSLLSSQSSPFNFVAQIDWSLLQNHYHTINKLVDSLSSRCGLNYHIAFTNITSGGESFRSAELYITSTGGTGGTRLKLPLHGFLDDGLVTYLSSSAGLPSPLTEICVEDTIPLDATTLSWASRNLSRLLENRANEIQRASFSITLPQIHILIPKLLRLYDLTFTHSTSTSSPPTSSLEYSILTSLSSPSHHTSSRISSPSRSSTISILTLPAHLLASLPIRNKISHLRRLQELKITFSSSLDIVGFGHLPMHRTGEFNHLRCLTFEGGTIPQFVSLLPTLFPSPFYSSSPCSSISTPNSSFPRLSISPSPSSINSIRRPQKFINLTLVISSLSFSSSVTDLISSINTYIPHGIDIFKLHVRNWGVGEPKNGAWWTKAGVCVKGGYRGRDKDERAVGLIQVPGRVMTDLAHPCREEIGCRVKTKKKSKFKRIWRKIVKGTSEDARAVHVRRGSESSSVGSLGSKVLDLKQWWERWRRSTVVLPVNR